jgi:hypothetical protein
VTDSAAAAELPAPSLRRIFRLDAELAAPVDLGTTPGGHRRVIAYTGGRVTGPALTGAVVADGGADWQVLRPDGVAVADIRCTLRTDRGALLLVTATGRRHGPPEVLERLGRGEPVAPDAYTFRIAATIETADEELSWLNDGVFIAVGAREPDGVAYDVYLVA